MSSRTYPDEDEVLGKYSISFTGIDWNYYDVHGLIEKMKRDVPKDCREYSDGWWLFEPEYKPVVKSLITEHFG